MHKSVEFYACFKSFQHATWQKRLEVDVAAKEGELEALKEARNVDRRLLGTKTLDKLSHWISVAFNHSLYTELLVNTWNLSNIFKLLPWAT